VVEEAEISNSNCCDEDDGTSQKRNPESCPSCGSRGKKVAAITPRAILVEQAAAKVPDGGCRYCPTPKCPTLYFAGLGWSAMVKDARVRVGAKEEDEPILLCYCFGHTRADVTEQVNRTGGCTIPAEIASLVKCGQCACNVKNPSGTCCLGVVRDEVRRALEEFHRAPRGEGRNPIGPSHLRLALPAGFWAYPWS